MTQKAPPPSSRLQDRMSTRALIGWSSRHPARRDRRSGRTGAPRSSPRRSAGRTRSRGRETRVGRWRKPITASSSIATVPMVLAACARSNTVGPASARTRASATVTSSASAAAANTQALPSKRRTRRSISLPTQPSAPSRVSPCTRNSSRPACTVIVPGVRVMELAWVTSPTVDSWLGLNLGQGRADRQPGVEDDARYLDARLPDLLDQPRPVAECGRA